MFWACLEGLSEGVTVKRIPLSLWLSGEAGKGPAGGGGVIQILFLRRQRSVFPPERAPEQQHSSRIDFMDTRVRRDLRALSVRIKVFSSEL